jgi:deoxycytidylate deaminase
MKKFTYEELYPIIVSRIDNSQKCIKQQTIAVIVTESGKCFVGTNWCRNPQQECPRKDFPTGVGYDLCKNICQQDNHAEVDACLKAGEYAKGADLYLIGHYYCCDNCKKIMTEYGIKDIVILN